MRQKKITSLVDLDGSTLVATVGNSRKRENAVSETQPKSFKNSTQNPHNPAIFPPTISLPQKVSSLLQFQNSKNWQEILRTNTTPETRKLLRAIFLQTLALDISKLALDNKLKNPKLDRSEFVSFRKFEEFNWNNTIFNRRLKTAENRLFLLKYATDRCHVVNPKKSRSGFSSTVGNLANNLRNQPDQNQNLGYSAQELDEMFLFYGSLGLSQNFKSVDCGLDFISPDGQNQLLEETKNLQPTSQTPSLSTISN